MTVVAYTLIAVLNWSTPRSLKRKARDSRTLSELRVVLHNQALSLDQPHTSQLLDREDSIIVHFDHEIFPREIDADSTNDVLLQ